jgi:uncharacterized membrane protein
MTTNQSNFHFFGVFSKLNNFNGLFVCVTTFWVKRHKVMYKLCSLALDT